MSIYIVDGVKNEVIKLRVSGDDIRAWRAAALADSRSLSDWIRMRCNGLTASKPDPKTPKNPIREAHDRERDKKRRALAKKGAK